MELLQKYLTFILYKRAFIHKSYTKRPQLYNLQENITITEQPIDCLPLTYKIK
jgi:hypothetical protein